MILISTRVIVTCVAYLCISVFLWHAEDGIRDWSVTGVQTCALPIWFVEMKFLEYNIAKPPFDTRECQQRGLTYAAAVRARLQMIIYDRESPQAKTVKEIKEQEADRKSVV